MENIIFRRAEKEELPRILAMQTDVFGGEQGIPCYDIDSFTEKEPIFWCAELNGKIYAATAAWKEDDGMHWGRFAVFPGARGMHIGTELARTSFSDLFSTGVDKIYMDARDATVKIVCRMGGQIIGQPYEFYGDNVTPVVLEKKNYK